MIIKKEISEYNSLVQDKLALLRLLGYIGAQFNALLVPLLIFKITGSAYLAGLALIIEWIPKLIFYIAGGAIVEKCKASNIHTGLEVVRLVSLLIVLLGALSLASVWVIAIAAAMYQCSNALSNILFERSVSRCWEASERPQGHARIFQQDNWGCLLALVLGLLIKSLLLLSVIACIIQLVNLLAVIKYRAVIYYTNEESGNNFFPQLRKDTNFIMDKEIIKFGIMSLLISIPIAFVFSSIVFLLAQSPGNISPNPEMLSFLLLSKTVLALIVLQIIRNYLFKILTEINLAYIGFAVLLLSLIVLTQPLPLLFIVIACSCLGTSLCFYLPWLRAERQKLIVRLIPLSSQSGVTGILIAVEALSYLTAAMILTIWGNSLNLALAITMILSCVGILMALFYRPPVQILS